MARKKPLSKYPALKPPMSKKRLKEMLDKIARDYREDMEVVRKIKRRVSLRRGPRF